MVGFWHSFWFWLRVLEFLFVPILLILLIWIVYQIIKLRREERADLRRMLEEVRGAKPEVNDDWLKILAHLSSTNPSDWKLAIIEADKMLDDLVKTMGYDGDSLGERLKRVEPSDFNTLSAAWSAHKVRNRIAHESGYELTEREARIAISNYQQVFEEFKVI